MNKKRLEFLFKFKNNKKINVPQIWLLNKASYRLGWIVLGGIFSGASFWVHHFGGCSSYKLLTIVRNSY